MRLYYRIVATINVLCVLGYIADLKWLLLPLIFTAIALFADGLTAHSRSKSSNLFLVGALFNFMGIVSGGITGIQPVLFMAVFGSIILLVAYWTDKPKTPPTTPGNMPE